MIMRSLENSRTVGTMLYLFWQNKIFWHLLGVKIGITVIFSLNLCIRKLNDNKAHTALSRLYMRPWQIIFVFYCLCLYSLFFNTSINIIIFWSAILVSIYCVLFFLLYFVCYAFSVILSVPSLIFSFFCFCWWILLNRKVAQGQQIERYVAKAYKTCYYGSIVTCFVC